MSKRLTELLRQRTLVQEHLVWLDREIAAEQDDSSSPPLPMTSSSVLPARSISPGNETTGKSSATPPSGLPVDVEKILAHYPKFRS